MIFFGSKIRQLRETQEMLLRQVAAKIDIDTALLSKIERGERRAQREYIDKVASVLSADYEELTILWLADRLAEIITDEPLADKALSFLKKQ